MPIQFNTDGLEKEIIQLFGDTLSAIDSCFALQSQNDITLPLKEFALFNHYSSIDLREVYKIADSKGEPFITFTGVNYSYVGYKGGIYVGEDYQIWAAVLLPSDFGHMVIKRERFVDRITELFNPIELDFQDDREFSRKYYVLARDKEKAFKLLNQSFRDELKRILVPDFYLEVLDNWLIVGNRKIVAKKEGLALASFVYNVSEIDYTN